MPGELLFAERLLPLPRRVLCRHRNRRPALRNLVALEAPKHEAAEPHLLARFGIRPASLVPAHDLVAFRDQLFDGEVEVGHPRVHLAHHRLVP